MDNLSHSAIQFNNQFILIMKKTIITLLALAGVAGAAIEKEYSANIVRSGTAVNADVTATFDDDSPISFLTFTDCRTGSEKEYIKDEDGVAIPDEGGNIQYTNLLGYKNTNFNNNTLTPDINVGNVGGWVIDMTFTMNQQLPTSYIEISSFAFNAFIFNGSGGSHDLNDNKERTISFTLFDGNTKLGSADYTFTGKESDNSSEWLHRVEFDTPIKVFSRGITQFRLEVEEEKSEGTFVGVKGVTIGVIPEPTTATLSLLALAGLVTRRRRK